MTKHQIIRLLRKYFDRSEDGKYANIVAEINQKWRKSK